MSRNRVQFFILVLLGIVIGQINVFPSIDPFMVSYYATMLFQRAEWQRYFVIVLILTTMFVAPRMNVDLIVQLALVFMLSKGIARYDQLLPAHPLVFVAISVGLVEVGHAIIVGHHVNANDFFVIGTKIVAGIFVTLLLQNMVQLILYVRSQQRFRTRAPQSPPQAAAATYNYSQLFRELTAGKVQRFAHLFNQLATVFAQHNKLPEPTTEQAILQRINFIGENQCMQCEHLNRCWFDYFHTTHDLFYRLIQSMDAQNMEQTKTVTSRLGELCIYLPDILILLNYEQAEHIKLQVSRQNLLYSKKIVTEQLGNLSQVMENLANEMLQSNSLFYTREAQVKNVFERYQIPLHFVEALSLEKGNMIVEVKVNRLHFSDAIWDDLARALSESLNEQIVLLSESTNEIYFGTAKGYEVSTGVAQVAKLTDERPGDSYCVTDMNNGKFAIALSDGMGNGERANHESSAALHMLRHFLQVGMSETTAIKSVNSMLMMRSAEEIFATVDVALIDLHSAEATLLKIGSIPSFIKRGDKVISLAANNLPVGIIDELDIELVRFELMAGDLLIMMTDGLYDVPGYAVNKELWLKRIIRDITSEHPQQVADELLRVALQYHDGEVTDDMTVAVAKIDKPPYQKATFSWPTMTARHDIPYDYVH